LFAFLDILWFTA